MPTRLLIVALDSAEPLLIDALAKNGALPTIQELLEKGQTAAIENYPGFGNGVFWPSINTGADPSHHGRYYRRQHKPETYSLEPFLEKDFKLPPFWKALDDKGMCIAVIDPVVSPGAYPDNGIEVLEWMSHGRIEPPRTSPSQLISELMARYGDDPFDGSVDMAVKKGLTPEGVIDLAKERIQTKTEAMIDLLDRNNWDLFYVSYADPHDVGHTAWHLHESEHNNSSPERKNIDLDPIEQCYQKLDASLAKLMDSVVLGGQTIVLMGPGIETNVTANVLLPDILRALQGRTKRGGFNVLARAIRSVVRSPLLSKSLGKYLRTSRARLSKRVNGLSGARYFTVPHNEHAGAVRINLSGRDPYGVVSQGQEYNDLCSELAERLMQIRDASGDIPLVKQVIKLHDHYDGPFVDLMPDLFVVWNRAADVSEVSSPVIGKIVNRSTNFRSGDHSTRGLLISSQPIDPIYATPLDPAQVTQILLQAACSTG